ncbi:hypothetical protein ABKN59_002877 [Abortiporus biennis]
MALSTTSSAAYILLKYSRSYPHASGSQIGDDWQHFTNPVIRLVLDVKKRSSGELDSYRLRILWNINTGTDLVETDAREVVFEDLDLLAFSSVPCIQSQRTSNPGGLPLKAVYRDCIVGIRYLHPRITPPGMSPSYRRIQINFENASSATSFIDAIRPVCPCKANPPPALGRSMTMATNRPHIPTVPVAIPVSSPPAIGKTSSDPAIMPEPIQPSFISSQTSQNHISGLMRSNTSISISGHGGTTIISSNQPHSHLNPMSLTAILSPSPPKAHIQDVTTNNDNNHNKNNSNSKKKTTTYPDPDNDLFTIPSSDTAVEYYTPPLGSTPQIYRAPSPPPPSIQQQHPPVSSLPSSSLPDSSSNPFPYSLTQPQHEVNVDNNNAGITKSKALNAKSNSAIINIMEELNETASLYHLPKAELETLVARIIREDGFLQLLENLDTMWRIKGVLGRSCL